MVTKREHLFLGFFWEEIIMFIFIITLVVKIALHNIDTLLIKIYIVVWCCPILNLGT